MKISKSTHSTWLKSQFLNCSEIAPVKQSINCEKDSFLFSEKSVWRGKKSKETDWETNLPILKLNTWLEQTALPPYSINSSIWKLKGYLMLFLYFTEMTFMQFLLLIYICICPLYKVAFYAVLYRQKFDNVTLNYQLTEFENPRNITFFY